MTVPAPFKQPNVQNARPLELFFDLVFVFAVTQLTGLISDPHSWMDYLQALLTFFSLMWMYDGFLWLTSNLDLESDRDNWLLGLAMVGFFVMALGIPTIGGAGGLPYALGYMLVVVLHIYLFTRTQTSSSQAIFGVAPYNFFSALMILFAAFVSGTAHWVLWFLAIGTLLVVTFRRREEQFTLSPSHFAERHGLLIIIALGESVMALGAGATGMRVTPLLTLFITLGLLLAGHLWWSYFGPNNERALHNLKRAQGDEQTRLALQGYNYSHMPMLFGIMMVSAALEVTIHHPAGKATDATAWNLAGGLLLFYLGLMIFHRILGLGPGRLRLFMGLIGLLSVPIGLKVGALWQLLAVNVFLLLLTSLDDYVLEPKRGG